MNIMVKNFDVSYLKNYKDAYCRCILKSLHTCSVQKQFAIDKDTIYRWTQDSDKYFEVSIIPRSLASSILVNSYNLQGHASTIKTFSLIKRDFFWKGMCKDIDKFIQNSNACKNHNLWTQSYNYSNIPPARRPFDSIACDLVGPFPPPSSNGNSYILTCMCLLTYYL